MSNKAKVLVAMSGGVDSSVTALLLKRAGYDCIGATMRLYDSIRIDCKQPTCCSLEDTEDARAVASALDLPFHVLDYRDSFDEQVIRRFVDEYRQGRTPNPCIFCNRFLKFERLLQEAQKLGCDFVATGHYARVECDEAGIRHLRCGVDESKDQSYVLYMLGQEELSHVLLPLGGLTKARVREIAQENGLVNAKKGESQDICFVPDGDYAAFLAREGVESAPGDILDSAGNVLGQHDGIIHYTIGQRKGLGVALGKPAYVTAIDAAANTVTIGPLEELEVPAFRVEGVVWTAGNAPAAPYEVTVRTHYHAKRVPALVSAEGPKSALVRVSAPLRAVAPGQAAVFYVGDEVVGGGTIASRCSANPQAI